MSLIGHIDHWLGRQLRCEGAQDGEAANAGIENTYGSARIWKCHERTLVSVLAAATKDRKSSSVQR